MQELFPLVTRQALEAKRTWNNPNSWISPANQQQQQLLQHPTHQLYKSDKFWAFTCGHVVDSSQVCCRR
jgi:hypothetical protein